MTAELNRKKEAKFDPDLANDCFEWIKLVLIDGGYEKDAELLNVVYIIIIINIPQWAKKQSVGVYF